MAVAAVAAAAAAVVTSRSRSAPKVSRGSGQGVAEAEVEVETAVLEGEAVVTGAGVAAASPSFSWDLMVRRMWTKADWLHVHAVSGALHTLVGLVYLLDVIAGDVVRLAGGAWEPHVSFDLVLLSMLFGAVNAVTGLQPSLLPRPFEDVLQLFGFGKAGNLQSAGFINTAFFYFFLTYQSLRALPDYPAWAQPLDPVMAAITLLAIFHAIFIINSWVDRGKLSQGFAIGMSAPLLLNVPVSLHLLFEGQGWVEKLSAAYPGWPEVFFSANYALAWAGSMVTLVLSLYERKVISITDRLLLTVFLGLITFTVIPLRGYLLVPQWFNGDQIVMLTLIPPTH